jgi:lipoprotein-releasing system permease protein
LTRRGPSRGVSPFVAATRSILFVALRQLWARKLLNGIAVFGVMLGVLIYVAISGMIRGGQEKFLASMLRVSPHITIYDTELHPPTDLLAQHAGGPVAVTVSHRSPGDRQARIKRPQEIVAAIRQMDGVVAAAASLSGNVLIEYGGKERPVDLHGIDIAAQEAVTPLEAYVTAGNFRGLATSSDGIAVGAGVAKALGLEVGDTVHAAAQGSLPTNLRVMAIFDVNVPSVDKVRGYSSLRNAQLLLGKPDIVGRIEVRLQHEEDAVAVTARIEQAFAYDAESWQEANANYLALFAMDNTIVSFVSGAILTISGFGILAIQIMIVLQKKRDIAILRSVGLRQFDILGIFLLQGFAISLLGAGLGCGAGKLAVHYLGMMKTHMEGLVKSETFLITDSPAVYLHSVTFALVLGVLAALLPAWEGAKVEPVDVLRGQIG